VTGESSVLRIEGFETLHHQDKEPSPMSQRPISELRGRMLEDMAVRKFSEVTIRNYIRYIVENAKFLGRSGYLNGGGRTPFPGAYDRERCTAAETQ
jgi:hypothetical protein